MAQLPHHNSNAVWALPARSDKVFNIRISRNILLGFCISLLLHGVLLWIFAPKLFSIGAPQEEAPPLEISLGPPQKKETAPSELVNPTPPPQTPAEPTKPKLVEVKPPKPTKTPVKVAKKSDIKVPPDVKALKNKPLNKNVPKPERAQVSIKPLPGEDMQAYIKRQKEAKLAAKGLSKKDVEEVMASNNPQSEGDKRDAKIKENLNFDGTNGIFEIRYLGSRSAKFSFKGWKNNINTARLEIIDVKAPGGTDIKRAVIKKMIEIIRREYSGDFNWDSRRLGRVLALSARREDNADLESFMMHEFFGPGSRVR